jgi:hypothetical protein
VTVYLLILCYGREGYEGIAPYVRCPVTGPLMAAKVQHMVALQSCRAAYHSPIELDWRSIGSETLDSDHVSSKRSSSLLPQSRMDDQEL